MAGLVDGWVGGWLSQLVIIQFQPSYAGVRAGADLYNIEIIKLK